MTLTPFARDLLERAVKSFLQGAVAAVGLQAIAALADNPLDLSAWQAVAVAALGGGLTALFSFATSLLSKAKTGTASASTVVAETAVAQATLTGHAPPITRKTGGRHEADPDAVEPLATD